MSAPTRALPVHGILCGPSCTCFLLCTCCKLFATAVERCTSALQVRDAFGSALTAAQVGMYGDTRPAPNASELAAFYDLLQHYLKSLAATLPPGEVVHSSHHSLQVREPSSEHSCNASGFSQCLFTAAASAPAGACCLLNHRHPDASRQQQQQLRSVCCNDFREKCLLA